MNTRLGAILVLLLLVPAVTAARDGKQRLGVAGSAGTQMCAALPAADAHAGERVAIVDPAPPQRVRWATLEHPAGDACSRWQHRSDVAGQVFALQAEPAPGEDDIPLGVVVPGARSVDVAHGNAVAHTDDGAVLHFRSCTSSEGVHLSAWPSSTLKGRPLWHAYLYLGYDVEPTCSEAETLDAR